MANFILRLFGGGDKGVDSTPPPAPAPAQKPVVQPEPVTREKTQSRFAGATSRKKEEEAKIAKKMLLGE